jgi:translation elongation factor aEF-1 beta
VPEVRLYRPELRAYLIAQGIFVGYQKKQGEKMAKIVVSMRVMPESPDTDLKHLEDNALKFIKAFAGDVETKVAVSPVAFGLQAVDIKFVLDESKGGTERLESEISGIEGVNSVEVTDVRRIIG